MNDNAQRKTLAALPPRTEFAMDDRAEDSQAASTARRLALLSQEADSLLHKLARLRQNLSEIKHEFETHRSSAPLVEANEQLVLAALHAETVAETALGRLRELALTSQHDSLTRLPNRMLMLDRLNTAIASARRHETRLAVLFIDLDNFKQINDTMGHGTGDEALKLVARRLQSAVRTSDTVSRHGGEEFLVLLTDLSCASDAAPIARKLSSAISAPARAGGHRVHLSASIGITIYPEDGEDAPTLIDRADAAMYRSKRRGPGGFEFYADKVSILRHRRGRASSG